MAIFDVMGPVMIGPSSSHTAGAAKIGYPARRVYGKPVQRVSITLYNSFAETGRGHGTHMALLGGILGLRVDDARIRQSSAMARIGRDMPSSLKETSLGGLAATPTGRHIAEVFRKNTGLDQNS